ncbi:MAG: phosphoglycerate kinase [Candidatus Aenigmarchaeota archaeon]|nr:phosphoglycerate kinase [Candidatus Aenigmarchaeota archaeon]
MNTFFSLNDFNLENKTVAVRVDLNLPYNIETEELAENSRLWKHAETIKELSDKKAKVVVFTHQSRKGKPDFISLEKHAKLLEKTLGQSVKFLPHESNFDEIKELKMGDVLLLDNTRFYDDETEKKTMGEHADSSLVKKLSPYLDYFILDSFSVSHRGHASVVGFANLKPCIAGPVFELEAKKLREFKEKIKNSKTAFILGGAKPEEPLELIEYFLNGNAKFLTAGVVSLLFLMGENYNLGKTEEFLKNKGYLDCIQKIREMKSEKIKNPVDLGIEKDGKRVEISLDELPANEGILDIGEKTTENYEKIISESDIVCMKGTAGVYENSNAEFGTKKLFDILKKHKCTLLGGGNTIDALEKFKIPFSDFTYVSLGGGAFVEFLIGKEMPGLKALEMNFEKFKNGGY